MKMCEALARLVEASEAIHQPMCSDKGPHSPHTCGVTPSVFAVADALDVLDARPTDIVGASLALHDRSCQLHSCMGDREAATEHAKRIQGPRVMALRKWLRSQADARSKAEARARIAG